LTIERLEICTQAHPTLNIAGSTQYHIFSNSVDDLDTKAKSIKIPINDGITSKDPKIKKVFLLPQGPLSLSERTPTIGVVMPSVI
jgi:hypothetical protein